LRLLEKKQIEEAFEKAKMDMESEDYLDVIADDPAGKYLRLIFLILYFSFLYIVFFFISHSFALSSNLLLGCLFQRKEIYFTLGESLLTLST